MKAWGSGRRPVVTHSWGCGRKSKSKGVVIFVALKVGKWTLLEMTTDSMTLMEEIVVSMEQSDECKGDVLCVCG